MDFCSFNNFIKLFFNLFLNKSLLELRHPMIRIAIDLNTYYYSKIFIISNFSINNKLHKM